MYSIYEGFFCYGWHDFVVQTIFLSGRHSFSLVYNLFADDLILKLCCRYDYLKIDMDNIIDIDHNHDASIEEGSIFNWRLYLEQFTTLNSKLSDIITVTLSSVSVWFKILHSPYTWMNFRRCNETDSYWSWLGQNFIMLLRRVDSDRFCAIVFLTANGIHFVTHTDLISFSHFALSVFCWLIDLILCVIHGNTRLDVCTLLA